MKKILIILALLFLISPVFAKTVQCVKKYQVFYENGISMAKLLYVKTLKDSRGIGVFNRMQGFIAFMGLFSNICVIFFTNSHFIPLQIVDKLIYLIITENFVFLVLQLVYMSQKPFWYRFKEFVEVKYLKYFGIRPKNIKEKFEETYKK